MKVLLWAVACLAVIPAVSQTQPQVKIGQLDLTVGGLSANVSPAQPVIPKNVASGVQIVASLNGHPLSANALAQYLGGSFQIAGEYSGPGLSQTVDVPQGASLNSLVLDLPAVDEAGNYTLSNLRFLMNGNDVFDLTPNSVVVDVIDQVIVSSVQTQALTLEQIQQAGVVLDGSDYQGFQFNIGLQLSSQVVNISLPVVFNPQGVAVPTPLTPPTVVTTGVATNQVPVPVTVVPIMLKIPPGASGARGQSLPPINVPSVLVIPGNVGYLKQFFSAQLYVANDTPAEANLVVDNISGTINLPTGPSGVAGASDEPLSLPNLRSGPEAITMPILLNGASTLGPGQTGQAQWTIVANTEGFYNVNFNINATLEGLPTGPVPLTGSAIGGLLVRNPYFNMTFTVPGVVRNGEFFDVYATVTNTSQAIANNLTVAIDASRLSGTVLAGPLPAPIPTLKPGDSTTLKYHFKSSTNGAVVASYLKFNTVDGTTGSLNFTMGVYPNGTPFSPDTIVLPSTIDNLPPDVVSAAMRVLGQAWSVATAPGGALPAGVLPTSTAVVTRKAQALAEAGLRQTLGEPLGNVLRDLGPDFWGGSPVDPGFNQILQTTPAGQNFNAVLAAALAPFMQQAGGSLPYELQFSQLLASGPTFLAFTAANGSSIGPVSVNLTDGSGNQLSTNTPEASIPGGVLLPLGNNSDAPVMGLVTAPTAPPYTLLITPQVSGSMNISITIPHGDGTVIRGETGVSTAQGQMMRVIADFNNPNNLVLQVDSLKNGSFVTSIPLTTQIISPSGPNLTSATVIGPGTVSQAGPFGLNMVMLFDRPVDPVTSAITTNYTIPNNLIIAASRELSGRMVFGNFSQPEGPNVPTTVAASGVADTRGAVGPSATVNLQSTLQDPGAVVTGRVLNANGTPSTTATVTYLNYPPSSDCSTEPPMPVGVAATQVNSSGYYQFRYVWQNQCGEPFQMVTNDSQTGATQQVQTYVRTAGQQIVLNLAMLGVGSVTGQVTDGLGNPVPDAQVAVVSGSNPQVGGQAYTDGNGNYTINNITVGPVTVTAVHGATLGSSAGNIELAGTPAVVNVVLNGGNVQVSGTVMQVVNSVSSPVAGMQVVYYVNGAAAAVATTANDGSYSMKNLPTGQYQVWAGFNYTLFAQQSGVAAAGDQLTIPLQIVIPFTGTVAGKVLLPDGTPFGGAIVFDNGQTAGVLSGGDGSYSLTGVPISHALQTIVAETSDGLRVGQISVTIPSSTPVPGVNITLSGVGVARFLVQDASGQPIVGQQVYLVYRGIGCAGTPQTTDANGIATFTGVGVGNVEAAAIRTSGGYTDLATATAFIAQDGQSVSATMQFHGLGTVTGTVIDPSGNPVLGAVVQLTANRPNMGTCSMSNTVVQSAQTSANGKFSFSSVAVGPVGVSATQTFYPAPAGSQGVLSTNGGNVNFTLQFVNTVAGVLSGTVYLPDGVTPVPGVQVTASGPFPNTNKVSVTTNAVGLYQFAPILPEGNYTLTAADPVSGGVVQTSLIYLRASQNVTENLRLLGTGTINVTVVDGAGNPVSAATVKLTESGYPNASFDGSISAATNGLVSFSNVFEGAFSVQASDALGRGGRASATLPQGTSSLNVQVQLTTTGTIQGHFYQADGATVIPNAVVQLTVNNQIAGEATTQSTGDVGYYSFTYVPAGPVILSAQDPLTGRTGTATANITTEGKTVIVDISEVGLATVQGLVTSNGAPQPAASVTITSGSNFTASTLADSTGTYLIKGVPVGTIVATASLGGGFLSGTATSSVSGDGNVLTLDVVLQNSGSVSGQVLLADGMTAAPASLVTLNLAGAIQSTTTDANGNYSFPQVPVGTGTITARELSGIDQGAAPVTVQQATNTYVNVIFNGLGTVTGVAEDSAGNPVGGTISITGGGGSTYYSYTTTAAADGTFIFTSVPAGSFTATLNASIDGFSLFGMKTGAVSPSQTTSIVIQAQPSGSVVGRIYHADGSTPDAGAIVSLTGAGVSGTVTVTSDSAGNYTFSGVPIGAFNLSVTDPVTSDRGVAPGTITSNGQTVTLNIALNGVGSVTINVDYSTGGIVPNAALTLTGTGPFGGTYSGTTGADGIFTFPYVLAGPFAVTASDPVTNYGGRVSGVISSGGNTTLTVQLQPVLTVEGYVYDTDGKTPVKGSTLVLSGLNSNGEFSVQTGSAADGSYKFANLQLGVYTLYSYDASGNLRARSSNITLSTVGPTTLNLIWQGIGTVTGFVYNPSGQPEPGAPILLHSLSPSLNEYLQTATNASGAYTVNGVPLGNFSISVSYPSAKLSGTGSGSITQIGQQTTVNIYLVNSAISLPVYLKDGNNYSFDAQSDGSIGNGEQGTFSGAGFRSGSPGGPGTGGFVLDILTSGTANRFTGNPQGSQELAGRQIDVTELSLAGLDVTRKVYVPQDGYFVRYLEELTNSGTTPVTVGVRLTSNQYTQFWPLNIVASSSGNATLNVTGTQNPDRWIVVDGAEGTSNNTEPAVVAYAFGGPGSALPVDTAEFTTPLYDSANLVYQWSNVTVPPGGTVALLHFGVQQSNQAAAQVSAARLIQLPPEALVGLSSQDLAAIQNFVVPANGISSVSPLPALNGTVTGYLYSGDASTPMSNQTVTLQSNNPYFNRPMLGYTNSTGLFTFSSVLNNGSMYSTVLPVDSFTLSLNNPPAFLADVIATGTFSAGQNSASQNFVLNGTGTINGNVTFFDGTPVTSGAVSVLNSGSASYVPGSTISSNGAYTIGGVSPGSVELSAYTNPSFNTTLTGTAQVNVIAGQIVTQNIALQGTGTIQGSILDNLGNVIYSAEVGLRTSTGYQYAFVNSAGIYSFTNLPVGAYSLFAFSGPTQLGSATATVIAGQTTTQNFQQPPSGTLLVNVTTSIGAPVPNSYVVVSATSFSQYGNTDSSGNVKLVGVPLGAFTVTAHQPGNFSITVTANGNLVTNGSTVQVPLSLPAVAGTASIAGQILYARGAAASGLVVTTNDPVTYTFISTQTDSNGKYTLSGLTVGSTPTINIYTSSYNLLANSNVTVGASGTTTTANLTLPALATLQVTVLTALGTPSTGTTVFIQDANNPSYFAYGGPTNSSGIATINYILQGPFTVQTNDPYTGRPSGSANGTVTVANDGATIPVTINLVFTANVQGTVFAADGQTAVANASVTAIDPTNSQQLGSTSAGSTGGYTLYDVAPSTSSFQIVVTAPTDSTITATANGSFNTVGQTVTVNVTLPLSVVSGQVTYSDGTPVSYPTVFVTQTDSQGNVTTYYPTAVDGNGNYSIYGVAKGPLKVFAQDSNTGLSGSASSNMVQLSKPVQLPVALQPSGTVTGAVQIYTGGAVPYDSVTVSSGAIQFDRGTYADANGNYSMTGVALGELIVSAASPNASYATGGAIAGIITTSGQTLTLNVPIAKTSTVKGTVYAADGVTPVPHAYVAVENLLDAGLAEYRYYQYVLEGYTFYLADANGNFQVAGVPIGMVQVTAATPDKSSAGWISGALNTGSTLTLNPLTNNGTAFPSGTYLLTDPNGFVYDLACDGSLTQGGINSMGLIPSYAGGGSLLVNFNKPDFCQSNDVAAVDQNGQQITIGPKPGGAANSLLEVTRQAYVPPTGGYIRYLDSVTNPLNVPVTTTVQVNTNFAPGDIPDTLLADPSMNAATSAVVQDSTSTAPILGFVFAGTNSPLAPVPSFTLGSTQASYQWTVTVPPNSTATLMHFLIQWNSQDPGGAVAQANSLVNLSDPNVTTGMSAQQKAQVANFNVH